MVLVLAEIDIEHTAKVDVRTADQWFTVCTSTVLISNMDEWGDIATPPNTACSV